MLDECWHKCSNQRLNGSLTTVIRRNKRSDVDTVLCFFSLSVANIILGLRLPHLDVKFAVYFMIAFCVCLGAVVVLEIVLLCSGNQKRNGKRLDLLKQHRVQSFYPQFIHLFATNLNALKCIIISIYPALFESTDPETFSEFHFAHSTAQTCAKKLQPIGLWLYINVNDVTLTNVCI